MRPNIAVFGQTTWTKLRRHKLLVQAIKGTAQGAGMVSRAEFAEFFELQEIFVGAGFVNTAKKGQAVTLSRVWGKHAAFIYRDRTAGPQAGMTYGFSGEAGSRIAGQIDEPKVGLSGSKLVRVGERIAEVVLLCERERLHRPISNQPLYNLYDRAGFEASLALAALDVEADIALAENTEIRTADDCNASLVQECGRQRF